MNAVLVFFAVIGISVSFINCSNDADDVVTLFYDSLKANVPDEYTLNRIYTSFNVTKPNMVVNLEMNNTVFKGLKGIVFKESSQEDNALNRIVLQLDRLDVTTRLTLIKISDTGSSNRGGKITCNFDVSPVIHTTIAVTEKNNTKIVSVDKEKFSIELSISKIFGCDQNDIRPDVLSLIQYLNSNKIRVSEEISADFADFLNEIFQIPNGGNDDGGKGQDDSATSQKIAIFLLLSAQLFMTFFK